MPMLEQTRDMAKVWHANIVASLLGRYHVESAYHTTVWLSIFAMEACHSSGWHSRAYGIFLTPYRAFALEAEVSVDGN
jgi:hypothetical protein